MFKDDVIKSLNVILMEVMWKWVVFFIERFCMIVIFIVFVLEIFLFVYFVFKLFVNVEFIF